MTSTRTGTGTFTEARVREVMNLVLDDFVGCVLRGFVSQERAQKWYGDLTYLLTQQAISAFELQFTRPNGTEGAFRYEVSDDGSLLGSSPSGGQKLHMQPAGTTCSIYVDYRDAVQGHVREEMRRRGWGPGASVGGDAVRDRAYSKDGYGLIRSRIGEW
ncbi:hypothetical protein [Myxococcus sp. CA033]|uniref:HORMA-1 domain-containing protein n=1 Tax=unclassified Myxococcus TaxID=2648731 RepID=UPI00157BAF1A|nr:hypothetical protein [Myxococcus sp. CA033]NTX54906.1 hypothetical protein [Myxococcus sp. CA039A]